MHVAYRPPTLPIETGALLLPGAAARGSLVTMPLPVTTTSLQPDPPPPGLVMRRATTKLFADGCWEEVVNITAPGMLHASRVRMDWDPGSWVWQHIEAGHTFDTHVEVPLP